MHLKTFSTVALAVVGAAKNVRDVEPCAEVSQLVADANQNKSEFFLLDLHLWNVTNSRS
jgi:hypothetical protein